jgi:hypothetical protein
MLVKKYCLFAITLAIVSFAAWAVGLAATGPTHYKSLYFKSDSNGLRPDSVQALNHTIADLKANPDWRLIIEGHTDDSGDAESNRRLSVTRAKTILDLIVAGGIDAGRLDVQGYGETRPLADNQTPEGRARNRRVELYKALPESPQAVVPVSHFEFESTVEGQQVIHEFRIHNKGLATLEIQKVKTG